MAGRNQHHIPQFFQRGFGVPTLEKPKEIWEFTKDLGANLGLISEIAADLDFYSEPSSDGAATLDDKITKIETPLARKIAKLRKQPVSSRVDAAVAADVITHLAPRTSHARSIFSKGIHRLLRGAFRVFGDANNVERLLGLDADRPSELFRKHFDSRLRGDARLELIGLPPKVLENVVFRLAKESFGEVFVSQIASLQMDEFLSQATTQARDGHNDALASILAENKRRESLALFTWTVEAAPVGGAILPDCIAIGYQTNEKPCPYMTSSHDKLEAVVMPLATNSLLVGRRAIDVAPDLSTINRDSAACSDAFFLAHADDRAFADLIETIGARSTSVLDQAVDGALNEFMQPALPSEVQMHSKHTAEQIQDSDQHQETAFSYEVSCLDWADQETAQRVADVVRPIVSGMNSVLPLEHLDEITFALDYPKALASVDRGFPGVSPARTVSEDVGIGVAMPVLVMRDGIVKTRLVIVAGVANGLLQDDDALAAWAVQILVEQLAHVAITTWFDRAFPNVLFKPWPDPYEGPLLALVNPALEGYAAARLSSGFSTPDTVHAQRELLITALTRSRTLIPKERLAYRKHGDLNALLLIANECVSNVMYFAGKLLGYCDGQEDCALDDDGGTLTTALIESGLQNWLPLFQRDLRVYWDRRERWESLDELYRFGRHFERLLWQNGIFPWINEAGECRVEIPLASDMHALIGSLTPQAKLILMLRGIWARLRTWFGRLLPRHYSARTPSSKHNASL